MSTRNGKVIRLVARSFRSTTCYSRSLKFLSPRRTINFIKLKLACNIVCHKFIACAHNNKISNETQAQERENIVNETEMEENREVPAAA